LAWIIRAAGYEPTPAEEMEYLGNTPAAAVQQASPAAPVASPNGATAKITLQAPTLLAELPARVVAPAAQPASAPTPAAAAQPTMQVNRLPAFIDSGADKVAERNRKLESEGVPMISQLQQELIAQLVQCKGIESTARSATLLNYLRFTRERADISIKKLITTIKAFDATALPANLLRKLAAIKEEGEQLLQLPERIAAAGELRQFALANAEALGTTETERLMSICGNQDWSAQQLLAEKATGVQYLAQQQAA
jgi:hypothetical protein